MNAIISKEPLIFNSEAPIEGKWYNFGTASREVKNLGIERLTFTQSDFNIDDINKYHVFAVKIVEGYEENTSFVAYKFFDSEVLRFSKQHNFYVFGFPIMKASYSMVQYSSGSGSGGVSFPADCEISKLVGNPVSNFTFTVQLLGMR